MKVYLVLMYNDDKDNVVGVADTNEQALQIRAKCESEFGDMYKYKIQPWIKNQVTINNIQYKY